MIFTERDTVYVGISKCYVSYVYIFDVQGVQLLKLGLVLVGGVFFIFFKGGVVAV